MAGDCPLALFSIYHWVSEDRWLPAAATLRLLDGVSLRGAGCDPHLGGWLLHFLQFYRPTIERVLRQRDRRLREHAPCRAAALEARDLEIPSHCPIDWAADLAAAEAELPSVAQAEAGPQPNPERCYEQREHNPEPAVQAGGCDAGQVGTHIATEGKPGPVAHQQPTQQGRAHGAGVGR